MLGLPAWPQHVATLVQSCRSLHKACNLHKPSSIRRRPCKHTPRNRLNRQHHPPKLWCSPNDRRGFQAQIGRPILIWLRSGQAHPYTPSATCRFVPHMQRCDTRMYTNAVRTGAVLYEQAVCLSSEFFEGTGPRHSRDVNVIGKVNQPPLYFSTLKSRICTSTTNEGNCYHKYSFRVEKNRGGSRESEWMKIEQG